MTFDDASDPDWTPSAYGIYEGDWESHVRHHREVREQAERDDNR